MKKLFTLLLVIAMCATVVIGCAAPKQAAPAEAAAPAESQAAPEETKPAEAAAASASDDQSLQYVMDKGTFIVGFDDAFPPFTYMDDNGAYTGFDIDMAKILADKMGVELVLQPVSWAAKEQELDTKNIDVIWSGLGIVGDRAEVLDTSYAYARSRGTVLVRKDSGIKTFADLAGKTVCFQSGGGYYAQLEEFAPTAIPSFGEVVYLDTTAELLMSLDTKGVDAVCGDNASCAYYATLSGFDFDFLYDDSIFPPFDYCVGLRKGDTALQQKVNEILVEMDKEGTIAELSNKWFGQDLTTIKEFY